MERQLGARFAARRDELRSERLRIDADAHAADLQRRAERLVPEQQVAVQLPVVVVGRAAVVRPAALQRAADLLDEHGAVLARDHVLALLRREVRVAVLELLLGDEEHIAAQLRRKAGELPLQLVERAADRADDPAHRILEELGRAHLAVDHLFPVPLVDVDRVEVVELLVAADRIHIRHKAVADEKAVVVQRQPLPLRQRVHDLRVQRGGGDVERDRALDAVQVVVQAGRRVDKQRRGHALQVQCGADFDEENIFDQADRLLRLIKAEARRITFRNGNPVHNNHPFFCKIRTPPAPRHKAAARRGVSVIVPQPRRFVKRADRFSVPVLQGIGGLFSGAFETKIRLSIWAALFFYPLSSRTTALESSVPSSATCRTETRASAGRSSAVQVILFSETKVVSYRAPSM